MRVSLLAVFLLSSSLMAGATTIDFNTLPTGTTSLSTYSEYGYTLTAVEGRFDVSTAYGNPGPALQAMQDSSLTVTDGGLFSFASVDVQLPAYSAYSDVFVDGWRDGRRIFTDEVYGDLSFDSYSLIYFPCCSPAVDTLEIQASQAIVLDNIVVNAAPSAPSATTPETSSVALLATGLLGVAGSVKRRRG